MRLASVQHHRLPQWIGPTVQKLHETPLSAFQSGSEIMSMITIELYATIAQLWEKLHLALQASDIYHARGCLNHQACFEAWQLTWLGTVGHKLLHPDELF
jgi:hypothetical protein